jgi:hypothetical protein
MPGMTSTQVYSRFHDIWISAKAGLKRKWPRVYFGLFVVGSLLLAAANNLLGHYAQAVVEAIARDIVRVLRTPLWMGGLYFLGFTVFVFAFAVFETTPIGIGLVRWIDRRSRGAQLKEVYGLVETMAEQAKRDEQTITELRRAHDYMWWRVQFGMEKPEVDGTCPTEVRTEIEKLRPCIREIFVHAAIVVAGLRADHMRREGLDELFFNLVDEKVWRRTNATFELVLSSENLDRRLALLAFDAKYNELRQWVLWLSPRGEMGDYQSDLSYPEWLKADAEYFRRTEELMAVDAFRSVGSRLLAERMRNKYPVALPRHAPPPMGAS